MITMMHLLLFDKHSKKFQVGDRIFNAEFLVSILLTLRPDFRTFYLFCEIKTLHVEAAMKMGPVLRNGDIATPPRGKSLRR